MGYKVIDVSHHQGVIDWNKVKKAGIEGVIIRTADSVGTMDRQCDRNIRECTRLGIPFGLYIHSRANNAETVKREAQICLDKAEGHILKYPIYIDLEAKGMESYAKTAAVVFGDIIEAAGYWAGVYANQSWWSAYLNGLTKYTKWVARYGTKPTINDIGMWQYSNTGKVDGIAGNVDLNECYVTFPDMSGNSGGEKKKTVEELAREVIAGNWGNGTEREMRLKAAGYDYAAVQKRVNELMGVSPESAVYYTIKYGDTLSQIAESYGTTYQKLMQLNGIKNADKIYAGQKIRVR